MMLVLSQFTLIQVSWKNNSASHKMVISRVIASAHLMSQLDEAQLGASSHVAQRPPTYRPIPHEEAASIHMSGSQRGSGMSERQAGGMVSVSHRLTIRGALIRKVVSLDKTQSFFLAVMVTEQESRFQTNPT